jgi:hypothetical protein
VTSAPLRQTSTTAIISLVSGLLGWTLLPLIGSVVAIVTGHMARAEIRRNPQALEGDGLAIAGLVLGYAMLAVAIASVVALFVFLGGLAAFFALASHWS